MKHLRLFLALVAIMFGMNAMAQKPASGTYFISNVQTGKYIKVYKKYYAKPDSETGQEITVGIGAKDLYGTNADPESYKLYDLSGSYDGGTANVFDYIAKAVNVAKNLGDEKIEKKLKEWKEKYGTFEKLTDEDIQEMQALFEDAADLYNVDYGYFNIEPVSVSDTVSVVRLKLEFPVVPNAVDFAARALTSGHKSAWEWAKMYVKKYVNEKENDSNKEVKTLVEKYLDQVEPGKTYYLIGQDDNTFDFCLASEVDSKGTLAQWKMELQEETTDSLTPGTYQIQNVGTEYVVEVTDKYKAEPDVTLDEAQKFEMFDKTMITLDFGRVNKDNANLYQITTLKNGDQEVNYYIIKKGVPAIKKLCAKKIGEEKENVDEVLKTINDKVKEKFYTDGTEATEYTYDQLLEDLYTFIDLYAEAYGNMKLVDNGDETVSLYVQVPEIPAILDELYTGIDNRSYENLWEFLKAQMVKYFESHAENISSDFVKRNLEKVEPGETVYLAADDYPSFDMLKAIESNSKWKLLAPQAKGFYRVKNVSSGNYVNLAAKDEIKVNGSDKGAAGSVFYVNAKGSENGGDMQLILMRTQGIELGDSAEATVDTHAADEGYASKNTINFTNLLEAVADKEGVEIDPYMEKLNDFNHTLYLKVAETEDTLATFYAYSTALGASKLAYAYADGEDIKVNKAATALADEDKAKWAFEPVDETNPFEITLKAQGLDGNYYASVFYDFPFVPAEGMKAYTITSVETEAVESDGVKYYMAVVSSVEKDTIAPRTPLIIEFTSNSAEVLPAGSPKDEDGEAGSLYGTFFKESLPFTVCGYGNETSVSTDNLRAFAKMNNPKTTFEKNNPVGFWSVSSSVKAFPGNKAFLLNSSNDTSGAKGYVFVAGDSKATGIANVLNEIVNGTNEYYDLQGRKVVNPSKGIYIKNGKKYVVK